MLEKLAELKIETDTDTEKEAGRKVKYASFVNCVSYSCRMTPFFDTVKEVEGWGKIHVGDTDNCYIRPVSNWQQIIDRRDSRNTDSVVPISQ